MFWLLKFIHEMGHAFSCRRFGGEVHEMGIMFLVFIPTPYVDASSAWAFPSRWQRMFVGAGGMIVELFLAALASFVYLATKPGVPVMGLPLRELMTDAMHDRRLHDDHLQRQPAAALRRLLHAVGLAGDSQPPAKEQANICSGLIKRHVFRIKSQQPLPPVGQRIWLFFYGIASAVYRVFVGVVIILLVAWQVPVLGMLMAHRRHGDLDRRAGRSRPFKYLALEPELHRKRGRASAFTLACVVVVVTLIGFIKFNVYVDAEGVVEPVAKEVLNARQRRASSPTSACTMRQWVKQGDVMLVLR